jgi:hypothetical protein
MLTYNIKSSTDKSILYNSKLFDYYRKLLKAELRGDVRPKPPSDEEALDQLDNKKILEKNLSLDNSNEIDIGKNQISENIDIKPDDNSSNTDSYMSSVGSYAKSLFGWGRNMGSLLGNKINESGIKEKIAEKTNQVSGVLSESINTCIQKGTEIGHTLTDKGTQIGKTIYEKGTVLANNTLEYTKTTYDTVKENGIKTTAANIYVSATGNITNLINSAKNLNSNENNNYEKNDHQAAGNEMEAKEDVLEEIKNSNEKN